MQFTDTDKLRYYLIMHYHILRSSDFFLSSFRVTVVAKSWRSLKNLIMRSDCNTNKQRRAKRVELNSRSNTPCENAFVIYINLLPFSFVFPSIWTIALNHVTYFLFPFLFYRYLTESTCLVESKNKSGFNYFAILSIKVLLRGILIIAQSPDVSRSLGTKSFLKKRKKCVRLNRSSRLTN